jgi:RNA-directed DNA polymerase
LINRHEEERQMTAVTTLTGASSDLAVDWRRINWRAVHRNVRRLQARIVKAVREKRWGKVKALQHLLTHSFSGKVLAVRRVTENRGKKTPGVDLQVWDTPEKKAQAVDNLKQRGYTALPLRRVYIKKSSGQGKRPLSIPTMSDRAMQALYLLALDPVAETIADPNSYGFRQERSTADDIEQCFTALARSSSAPWALKCDIGSCFDKLSHQWLKTHIPIDGDILDKWLKAGYIDKEAFHPTEEGVPQGSIASPVIANLALDGIERTLREKYPPNSMRGRQAKVNTIRYGDDIVITGSTKELLENEIVPLVKQFLDQRGLTLSAEKTRVVHIEEGFDFLGQNIRKYAGKLLITPAKKNVKAFLRKIREVIGTNKGATAGHLIAILNPIIRGWANYHRHVVSKETFAKVDNAIYEALWDWAKRRHPKKNHWWVRKKYYHPSGSRQWVFYGEIEGRDGAAKEIELFKASSIPIKRHTKIKAEANPYDPEWEPYIEERMGEKMLDHTKGYGQLVRLWFEQDGLCPICDRKITKESGWNIHHIIWRSKGGNDGMTNRVLLHPECHRQVHSLKLEVDKPCRVSGIGKA